MTNRQSAGKKAATSKSTSTDNLISLGDKSRAVKQAGDINSKINLLEDSLGNLQSELNEINSSVVEGLDRLSDSDLDLTSKVAETYKHLGEIDKTYKSLAKISDDIDSEVKKLSSEIADVAEQSAAELENLENTSSLQYSQLSEAHELLSQRVGQLVVNARDTHAQLTSSIKHNTDSLLKLEKQLIAEINDLSNTTQERDDKLEAKLGQAEKSISSNKATIIKMQGVDDALDKRATELEMTSVALLEKSLEHQTALQQLDTRSNELAWSVEQLQAQAARQADQIIEIQTNASLLSRSLAALTNLEKTHFRIMAGALLIIALVMASFAYYQHAVNGLDTHRIAGVQSDLASINNKLQHVDDKFQSLDGRMNYMSPFSQFGKDNVIHGPQWLASQPADHFAIQLASASSKNELYTIAQRYSHYFTEAMSYYTINTPQGQRHVLVYGSFADSRQASASLWRMPHYINQQRPVVARMGDIQKLI